jgi:hypothetical protein
VIGYTVFLGLYVLERVSSYHLAQVHAVGAKLVDVLRKFRRGDRVEHRDEFVAVECLAVGRVAKGDGLGSGGDGCLERLKRKLKRHSQAVAKDAGLAPEIIPSDWPFSGAICDLFALAGCTPGSSFHP